MIMHGQLSLTDRLEITSSNAMLVGNSSILLLISCRHGEYLGAGVVSSGVGYHVFWIGGTMPGKLNLVGHWFDLGCYFATLDAVGLVEVEESCILGGNSSTLKGELACGMANYVGSC